MFPHLCCHYDFAQALLLFLRPSLLAPAALCLVARAMARAAVLGVAPDDQPKYDGMTFQCLNGEGAPLPAEAVNDEFCDCADGSDEPGTGACAGLDNTLFFCPNEGGTPKRLYASRVGDGMCDCCDGSDEASLASRRPNVNCTNTCWEEGREERVQVQRRNDELRAGLKTLAESRAWGLAEKERLRAELARLKAELPALEKALEATSVKRATSEGKSGVCMWRQTGGCDPDGPREPKKDRSCTRAIPGRDSGYCDCNGNFKRELSEPGFNCETSPTPNCHSVCKPLEKEATEARSSAQEEGKEVVSPAASKEEQQPSQEASDIEQAQVSEYAKWMDGAASMLGSGDNSAEKPSVDDGNERGAQETTVGLSEQKAAQKLVDANKERTRKVQATLASLPDSHLVYSSLLGSKLSVSSNSGKDYQVMFFEDAKQDNQLLGRFKEWNGPRTAIFEGGSRCWSGGERKLYLHFQCGLTPKLGDVRELEHCKYEASVWHPGACDDEERDEKPETKVLGPRGEL